MADCLVAGGSADFSTPVPKIAAPAVEWLRRACASLHRIGAVALSPTAGAPASRWSPRRTSARRTSTSSSRVYQHAARLCTDGPVASRGPTGSRVGQLQHLAGRLSGASWRSHIGSSASQLGSPIDEPSPPLRISCCSGSGRKCRRRRPRWRGGIAVQDFATRSLGRGADGRPRSLVDEQDGLRSRVTPRQIPSRRGLGSASGQPPCHAGCRLPRRHQGVRCSGRPRPYRPDHGPWFFTAVVGASGSGKRPPSHRRSGPPAGTIRLGGHPDENRRAKKVGWLAQRPALLPLEDRRRRTSALARRRIPTGSAHPGPS